VHLDAKAKSKTSRSQIHDEIRIPVASWILQQSDTLFLDVAFFTRDSVTRCPIF
jgi:hypothetical protein